jgi:Protein of unknown function (DUF3592)
MKQSQSVFYKFFGLPFILVGLGIGYYNYSINQQTSEKTEGKVTSMNRGGKGGFAPVFDFTTKTGEKQTYKSNFYSSPPLYQIGEVVPLYYNPDNPSTVRTDSFTDNWVLPIAFTLGGLLLMGTGFWYVNRKVS